MKQTKEERRPASDAVLLEDVRQQVHDGDKHAAKHEWWAAHGVEVVRTALSFGDYQIEGSNRSIDTKASVYELMGNLGAGYRRLDHECARAREAGYRLVFLVESGEQFAEPSTLASVRSQYCMRCSYGFRRKCVPTDPDSGCQKRGDRRKPFQGYQMAGKMAALSKKHGAEFMFCEPGESARIICDLLGVAYDAEGGDGE